jgi:hypothetical protein
MKPNRQVIRVWGEFACFTRPEMKVERFSYPVPTPFGGAGDSGRHLLQARQVPLAGVAHRGA